MLKNLVHLFCAVAAGAFAANFGSCAPSGPAPSIHSATSEQEGRLREGLALLETNDFNARMRAIDLILPAGKQAFLPLCSLLKSGRDAAAMNAILMLGHLNDPAAVPALRDVADRHPDAKFDASMRRSVGTAAQSMMARVVIAELVNPEARNWAKNVWFSAAPDDPDYQTVYDYHARVNRWYEQWRKPQK